ncbi:MAG: pyruvate kinase [Bacilli bacterium]|nr:pyruvate kinase [Bacilli bacterium]MDD4065982.1 pyruvate kinase [Bacilli bacterium]
MFTKKTKIIATIGPVSESKEVVIKFIKAGMNIARLNFSHGSQATHLVKINMLHSLQKEGYNIAIMLDTKGPEIRSGEFSGGQATFTKGKKVAIYMSPILGDNTKFSVSFPDLIKDVKANDILRFDDGKISFKVLEKDKKDNCLICRALNNHTMADRRGCAAPGVKLSMPFMSKQDESDIRFGAKNQVDYIAASFVRKAKDIHEIREILKQEKHEEIQIIAKIECQEGVDNLTEIIKASDGVMVARGDLGVGLPAEDVPVVQRMIVEACATQGKPVIVATHMLDSMQHNPFPTRAEVSDVANAIYEACDSIMLSGESASGDFPVESVEMEARIATRIESTLNTHDLIEWAYSKSSQVHDDAIAYSVASAAFMTGAKLIVAFSMSGSTSRRISRYRPSCPILSLSKDPQVARSLCLNWGVYGQTIPQTSNMEEVAKQQAKALGYKKNDTILMTGGNGKGSTNFMKILILD